MNHWIITIYRGGPNHGRAVEVHESLTEPRLTLGHSTDPPTPLAVTFLPATPEPGHDYGAMRTIRTNDYPAPIMAIEVRLEPVLYGTITTHLPPTEETP